MKIDIEDIKALDSGKIYWISIDVDIFIKNDMFDMLESLLKQAKELGLTFIIADKSVKPISVPEGLEIIKK